jgi:hypothetical protein
MEEDLAKSGLEPADLDARLLEDPERAMCRIPPAIEGYVLPYWDIDGKPQPYYRVRQFDSIPKYRAVKDSQNYVYFPKNFKKVQQANTHSYVIITEGEKKAAKAIREGFPAVALAGVDSWKTKTLVLPEGTELTSARVPGGRQGLVKAKLPSTNEPTTSSTLAIGLEDLISFVIEHHLSIIICFDSDNDAGGTKFEVQRAAATLAFELRHQGIPFKKIRQIVLPPPPSPRMGTRPGGKVGLDDYLMSGGAAALETLCESALSRRTAFPRHPNVREFIGKKLQNPRIDRKSIQSIGLAILADMDARGRRLRSKSDDQLYYFDDQTRQLIKVYMAGSGREIMNDTPFARHLYNEYGVSIADTRLVQWFSTQFASEEPIEQVRPYRVLAQVPPDAIAYQINDGSYARISVDGLDILDNGEDGIMFESEQVQPIDSAELIQAFEVHSKIGAGSKNYPMWWKEVLKNVRLKEDPYLRDATALLYYLSPWLLRWRGTQLPIELVIGESGSGKSSLYELRLHILLGYPALRNAPQDLKDWHASVAHSGGLHVTDNVQLVDKNLRQRLSDELCRIVTEPDPHIEMRKLYSNAELMRIPVSSVFAITAIQQPFLNSDLIQRSVIIELDKGQTQTRKYNGSGELIEETEPITFDSRWVEHQLAKYGTRTDWIAHHLIVLHRFFGLVKREWDPSYNARHRLINLEQAMILMAKVFGMDHEWIPKYLAGRTEHAISDADWALEGLMQFAETIKTMGRDSDKQHFTAADVAAWATTTDDFADCFQLTNPRRLGRYIQAHKQLIQSMAGIHEKHKHNNKVTYWVPKRFSGDPKKRVEGT